MTAALAANSDPALPLGHPADRHLRPGLRLLLRPGHRRDRRVHPERPATRRCRSACWCRRRSWCRSSACWWPASCSTATRTAGGRPRHADRRAGPLRLAVGHRHLTILLFPGGPAPATARRSRAAASRCHAGSPRPSWASPWASARPGCRWAARCPPRCCRTWRGSTAGAVHSRRRPGGVPRRAGLHALYRTPPDAPAPGANPAERDLGAVVKSRLAMITDPAMKNIVCSGWR